MAAAEKYVLDLSGLGIKKLDKRDGVGIKHLILDNNELSKLENLESFQDLEKLSVTGNSLVRMYGVSKCRHITYLNLSNNSIVCIEGLKEMTFLSVLNLSVNSIKSIQNLQFCENLSHLDLSKNNIVSLANISCLTKLKTLHLNGNKICSLNYASKYLPVSIAQLSLADNSIADLNEILHLHGLEALEQLTIEGNPCVQMSGDLIFNYRPFVINWCLGLRLLDGYVASHKESLKAEWLYSQGKGRHFCVGEHDQLVEYLAIQCPLSADKDIEEEDEKLSRILHMQRQHKEQFLNEQAQTTHQEQPPVIKRKVLSKMSQSFHSSEPTQTKAPELRTSTIAPSKVMYESAPDVLFNTAGNELANVPSSSMLTESTGQPLSKSEQLHNSARSPITIEQVAVDIDANKAKPTYKPPTPHQHYEERRLRPSSVSDTSATVHPKGNVIRKVSKRATSPSVSTPSPGRAKGPGSFRSKLSPSRSCIINSKLSLSKNSSESDTSEELSQLSGKGGLPSNMRRGPRSQSQTCSPVYRQKFQTSSMKGTPDFESNKMDARFPVQTTQPYIIQTSLNQMLATQFGQSEEKLNKAAVKIQAIWRGYHVRHCNHQVYKLRQEIRFRRMEDHIHHLHSHMCRLTDFVLRQQKDLLHERELRKMQAEDIRTLHEKAKDLQKDVAQILKAKQTESPKVSEPDSYDISNSSFGRKCISKDNKYFSAFDNIKNFQDVTPDTPSSSLQYSTQAFQENSGLFSPSSQTSSVTSAGPDGTFNSMQNRHILQPSTSDLSDADSGLQSMVSPNLSTFIELERHICGDEVSNTIASSSCYPTQQLNQPPSHFKKPLARFATDNHEASMPSISQIGASDLPHSQLDKKNEIIDQGSIHLMGNHDATSNDESSNYSSMNQQSSMNVDGSCSSSHCSDSSLSNQQSMSSSKYIESNSSSCTTVASVLSNHTHNSEPDSNPTKVDASLSPIFPCPPSQISGDLLKSDTPTTSASSQNSAFSKGFLFSEQMSKEERDVHDFQNHYPLKTVCEGKNSHCTAATTSSSSLYSNSIPSAFTMDDIPESDRSQIPHASKMRPSILTKGFIHGNLSNSSTPLEDGSSPQSPCTVEMSGRISHSCSFQSDGFTAAEELSATTTVKLFSARTMSMACGSTPQSPQPTIQRPLSLSEPLSQQSICSPLVLASNVWEKKVQDIDTTFQRLQAQIRDLEGSVGQVGQLGQFWYPALLSEESKDPRHLIHYMEPNSGALMLDMPKVNFKCSNNGNSDFLLQTHFARHAANGVPFLPPSSSQLVKPAQNSDFCRIEELDPESQNMSDRAKYLKLPLHEKASSEPQGKQ